MPLADATLQTIARSLAGLELEPVVLLKIGAAIPAGGQRRLDAGVLLQPDAGSDRLAAGKSVMTRKHARETPFRKAKPRRDVVIADDAPKPRRDPCLSPKSTANRSLRRG
jgi:hypothetical protein